VGHSSNPTSFGQSGVPHAHVECAPTEKVPFLN